MPQRPRKRTKKTALLHTKITDESDALLEGLTAHFGVSRTAIVEMSIRLMAKENGVKPKPREQEQESDRPTETQE